MDKEIKRGYVKWTDEDGVFHKEPLADHADMLKDASAEQKLRAEEVRRLNAAAEEDTEDREDRAEQDAEDTLAALREAPDDILTASALVEELDNADAVPASAASETAKEDNKPADQNLGFTEHEEALRRLREETAE